MNRNEIMRILPHREPMLLLDDAERIGSEAVAHLSIKGSEPFLDECGPDGEMMPQMFLCEIMGQSCCVLFQEPEKRQVSYFTSIDYMEFHRTVRKGDTIEVHSSILRSHGRLHIAESSASVDGEICAKGRLSFYIADE